MIARRAEGGGEICLCGEEEGECESSCEEEGTRECKMREVFVFFEIEEEQQEEEEDKREREVETDSKALSVSKTSEEEAQQQEGFPVFSSMSSKEGKTPGEERSIEEGVTTREEEEEDEPRVGVLDAGKVL